MDQRLCGAGEKEPSAPLPPGEVVWEEDEIVPYPLQLEALEALQQSRRDGKRALLVMATGLGKTYVSIFDTKEMQAKRILFVAHRNELIIQATDRFRRLYPKANFGWMIGKRMEKQGDIVLASVQKLSRHLEHFSPTDFDYIIIDEVHHATAKTYRQVIDYFHPRFLLGLTATPDRR